MAMLWLGAASQAIGLTNTWTFPGFDLGTADATRRIIVYVGLNNYASILPGSVGGIAKDSTFYGNSLYGRSVSHAAYPVPTGTTGDIVVNCASMSEYCFIGVWWTTNLTGYECRNRTGVPPRGFFNGTCGGVGYHTGSLLTQDGNFGIAAAYYAKSGLSVLTEPTWDPTFIRQAKVEEGTNGVSFAHRELTDTDTITVGADNGSPQVGFTGQPMHFWAFIDGEGGPPGGGGGGGSWQNTSLFEWDNGQ